MPFQIVQVGKYWKIFKLDDQKFAKPRFRTYTAARNQAKNWMRYHNRQPFKIKKIKDHWRIYKPITKELMATKFKTKSAAQRQAMNWLNYARTHKKSTK